MSDPINAIADFLFEVGILKKVPRTGYAFFGTGGESVAEHIARTACVGYALAHMQGGVDPLQVAFMCLVHDLPEARTGDLNYVNKKYVQADEEKAIREQTAPLPFGPEIKAAMTEFNVRETQASLLANDADQIELLLQLKELGDAGNPRWEEWASYCVQRLKTDEGKELAKRVLERDSSDWWFSEKGDWWVNGGNEAG